MLLNVLLVFVLFMYLFNHYEGLTTTYTKYKEIKHNYKHKISGDTDCIYTQIPPQISKIYSNDYDSPFDRYNSTNVDSKYNKSYYDKKKFNIDIDMVKQDDNQIMPFYKSYTYCDLSNNLPTCTYTSCGIPEEKHDKLVAEYLQQKKMETIAPAQQKLSDEVKSNLSNYYNNNIITNNYLESIK